MIRVMHILSGDLWAGAEAQAYQLIRALRLRGNCDAIALLLNDGLLARRLRQANVPVEIVEESHNGFGALLGLVRNAIRRSKPSVLHTHGYKENLLGGLAARLDGHSLPVRTQHGTPFAATTSRMRFYSWIDRKSAPLLASKIIAISDAVRIELARFLAPERIRLVPNGISLPEAGIGHAMIVPLDDCSFLIGAAGRLAPEKRIDLLIRAIAHVRESDGLRVGLVLAGDGPERSALEDAASRLAPGQVYFAGFQEDLHPFYQAIDMYAISSDREGLPISLLEALSHSLPVAATSVGGIPEVLGSNDAGLLTERGSATGLARLIGTIAGDRSLARQLGDRGRRVVEENYSAARTAELMEEVYNEIQ